LSKKKNAKAGGKSALRAKGKSSANVSKEPDAKQRPKSPRGLTLIRQILLFTALALSPIVLAAAIFAIYAYAAVVAGGSAPTGTLAGLGVSAPVHVTRDARGIPHVRAQNERDLFFAEGYLQGADRLFQLDIYKRAVAGRLSEILGSSTLDVDAAARTCDVRAIARAQLALMPANERANLDAFARGVNAAIRTRPLPPEFRILAYSPEPWTAEDSLLSSFATVLALTDTWDDVATRVDVARAVGPQAENAFFSITDPAYDAPTMAGAPAPVATLPPLGGVAYAPEPTTYGRVAIDARAGSGSNDFTAGAALTSTHRSLLANDPHLELRIPGVWWLVDLAAPGFHAAGATFAGVPGVILGHNAHLAWGATNGTVTTVRIYAERFRSATSDEYLANGKWVHAEHRSETFGVRFGNAVVRDYLRTRHGFVFRDSGTTRYAAAWTADMDRHSSFAQFDGLDRAPSVAAAFSVLARYPGPPQNFVLADDRGNAGYVLAGEIPLDDAWGLRAHDGATEPVPVQRNVPFAALPHVAPGRNALAFTANDRVYATGYPYRLTSGFAPPYRAARIKQLLAHRPYDVASFSAIQADIVSLPERDLAARAARALDRAHVAPNTPMHDASDALHGFDGRFVTDSRAPVYVNALRRIATEKLVRLHMPPAVATAYLQSDGGEAFVALMRMLRERPHGWVPHDDVDAFLVASVNDAIADMTRRNLIGATWGEAGARTARHPLASLGLNMFNGVRFPGLGDGYAPHVQAPANAQSFRAVWDVGNWEAGGMVIPLGESGEPGSPHYRDLAPTWLAGTLVPFPFDDAAVRAATVETLDLTR
jgi:penicillin amidase